jgi:ankyrin repeat protein
LLQAQVCHAAFIGDFKGLQLFLPHVQVKSNDCIHYAAAGGHVNIVQTLLEEGFSVDCTNSHGQTPLHVAALFGRTEVVIELLKNGADIDKTIEEDFTCCPPLDGVVNGLPEHLNTVLALLDEGYSFRSDLNVFLLIFMRERNKLMLELRKEVLVDSVSNCYSDADLQTEWGKFPGTVTTFLRSLLKLIRTGESTESEALVFGAALHQAALRGHLDTVQVLLEWNCDPCSVDSLGRSALHVAAGVNIPDASINLYVNVVAHLVLGGCPVNMKNNWGCSPLHIAAHAGQSKIVTELLTHGADKDAFAGHFGTPLHQAALKSHLLTLKALLDEGCNVCAVDEVGRTPLHCAATTKQQVMVTSKQ